MRINTDTITHRLYKHRQKVEILEKKNGNGNKLISNRSLFANEFCVRKMTFNKYDVSVVRANAFRRFSSENLYKNESRAPAIRESADDQRGRRFLGRQRLYKRFRRPLCWYRVTTTLFKIFFSSFFDIN